MLCDITLVLVINSVITRFGGVIAIILGLGDLIVIMPRLVEITATSELGDLIVIMPELVENSFHPSWMMSFLLWSIGRNSPYFGLGMTEVSTSTDIMGMSHPQSYNKRTFYNSDIICYDISQSWSNKNITH